MTQPRINEQPRQAKPWYKKWWVIALGVLVVLATIGNLMGGDDDTATPSPTATASQATEIAEPEPVESTPAAEPAETTAPAETTEPAAPETTESVLEEPKMTDDEAETVIRGALGMGGDLEPSWAMPITEMDYRSGTLSVSYQESLTDEERVTLGQYIFNFVRAADPPVDLGTIVVTDTSGLDFNVFCGKTICSNKLTGTY